MTTVQATSSAAREIPPYAVAANGKDPKRFLWPFGLLVPLLPLSSMGIFQYTHKGLYLWDTGLYVYLFMPVFDYWVGRDHTGTMTSPGQTRRGAWFFKAWVMLYVPLQYLGFIWACYLWTHFDMSWLSRGALVLSAGTVGGIGINAAHELGHKRPKLERFVASIALAQTFYGHFTIEHTRGHHVRVATRRDPASAMLGEPFWFFLPRSTFGGLRSAWKLESNRLRLRRTRVFSPRNELLQTWALSTAIWAALAVAFGPGILYFLVAQAIFGFGLLEVTNFLEHYGLARQLRADGRYEAVGPQHSWDSTYLFSNLALFHLQRHSDHHQYPTRPYQDLQDRPEAPRLPVGYSTLIMAAVVPPLFRRLMDRRVLRLYGGDLDRANVWPPARKGLERRYGATSFRPPRALPPLGDRPPHLDEPGNAWLGAAASAVIVLASVWWVVWTVLPVPGLDGLGVDNGYIATPLLLVALVLMRTWRKRATSAARAPEGSDNLSG